MAFKNEKAEAVRRTKVKTRINDIVNRLNKTKVERFPDLQAEREAYDEGAFAGQRRRRIASPNENDWRRNARERRTEKREIIST